MSVRCVDEACHIEFGKLVMVYEANTVPELSDVQLVKTAMEDAKRLGYHNMGLNGQSNVMPCDENGVTPNDWNELNKLSSQANPKFRKEITLVSRAGM